VGKDVLDVGSIGQTNQYCLWEFLNGLDIKSLTGIDLPCANKSALNYFQVAEESLPNDKRIVSGDMENAYLGREFDVIIAGDVLEHVNNQGLFLSNIHRHLKMDGVLILTTPNAKWFTAILRPNATHVLWHDRYTLFRILENHRFVVKEFYYYTGNKKHYNQLYRMLAYRQGMLAVCGKMP